MPYEFEMDEIKEENRIKSIVDQGWKDRKNGKVRGENPYTDVNSKEHKAWNDGFERASKEFNDLL